MIAEDDAIDEEKESILTDPCKEVNSNIIKLFLCLISLLKKLLFQRLNAAKEELVT